MKLDFDAASYKLLVKLKSHSDDDVKFRVILCAPSVDKDKDCIYYSLSPNKVFTHPIIFANPKKEGPHDFQIIITDDKNNHLTTANFKLEIKKSGWKKALDLILQFVPLVGML